MEQKSSAADRIRPFLQAMERSIDRARVERTVTAPPAPTAVRIHQFARPAEPLEAPIEHEAQRLKARPKRRFLASH